MSFGEKLYQLRNERGIYQKEIAEYLEVSVGTISNYENCVHSPDLNTLCRLAGFFHVTTDFLLELTDNASSMECLNIHMSEDCTVGRALNIVQGLSQPSRLQMLDYIRMIKACEDMPRKNYIIDRQKQLIEQQATEISRLKELLKAREGMEAKNGEPA